MKREIKKMNGQGIYKNIMYYESNTDEKWRKRNYVQ